MDKEQVERLVVGAIRSTKKDHQEFNIKEESSFTKRLIGNIYSYFNHDKHFNGDKNGK